MNPIRDVNRLFPAYIAPLMLAAALPLTALAAPPPMAAAQGFNENTFSSDFTTKTVDMNSTENRGFKWYMFNLFSKKASATGVQLNSDGSVTLVGDNTGAGGALMSVNPYFGTNTWTGTAFGGGAYIEAVLHYDPAQVNAVHANGARAPYPSFWGLPMEGNVIQGANQWPGQPAGYQHNVEADFFEADYTRPTMYGVGAHDWYGIKGKTCPNLCVVSFQNPSGSRTAPAGTDMTQYHTYGFLWVPATASTDGIISAYFDGELIGATRTWTQYTDQPPTPVGKPWTFGRLDQQHMFLILGAGVGEPMTVKSINIWQKNAASNMSN
jgi:hypothetical protein